MDKYKEVKIVCPNCKREIRFAIGEKEMGKRKIEVVKLGEMLARLLNDRISIEFSPYELSTLGKIFELRAVRAETYGDQTQERCLYEIFEEAFELWEEKRKEGELKEIFEA